MQRWRERLRRIGAGQAGRNGFPSAAQPRQIRLDPRKQALIDLRKIVFHTASPLWASVYIDSKNGKKVEAILKNPENGNKRLQDLIEWRQYAKGACSRKRILLEG